MKTPSDILFARHQAATPKLDAIRREVVAGLNHQDAKTQSRAGNLMSWCFDGSKQLWQELIWPSRRIWTGLATVWILIFIVNFSQRDPSSVITTKSSSPQMMLTFRQQERLLAELTGPNEPLVSEPPKRAMPRPRSELCLEVFAT